MIASSLGYIEVVDLLVTYGAILNSRDKNGNTGLFNFIKNPLFTDYIIIISFAS